MKITKRNRIDNNIRNRNSIKSSVTYPNGREVSDVDLDTYLDYMYGTDRDKDNSKYTESEKQRATDYWFEVHEPNPTSINGSTDWFYDWYDSLNDEDRLYIDSIADEEGIPYYDEASDSDLSYLMDRITSSSKIQSNKRNEVKRMKIKASNLSEYRSKSIVGGAEKKRARSKNIDTNTLKDEIEKKVVETMQSYKFGYSEEEAKEYSVVEVKQIGDATVVEIRAEVSYEGLEDLCEACNPIVEKYRKTAYFEPVTPGIAQAWIGNAYVASSSYGGAFDIQDDEYFTREEIDEWAYDLVERFNTELGTDFDVESVYVTNNVLELTITDGDYSFTVEHKIDMRRILRPSDIHKYDEIFITKLTQEYNDVYSTYAATNTCSIDTKITAADVSYEADDQIGVVSDPDSTYRLDVEIDDTVEVDDLGGWNFYNDGEPWVNDYCMNNKLYTEDTNAEVCSETEFVSNCHDILTPSIPVKPGKYKINANLVLVYNMYGIDSSIVDSWDDEERGSDYIKELNVEDSYGEFDFGASSVRSMDFEEVDE